jgi:FKBP-type peptidyl-prolyl cis-trans isomerase
MNYVAILSLILLASASLATAGSVKSPIHSLLRTAKNSIAIASTVALVTCSQPAQSLAFESTPWDKNIQYEVIKAAPGDSPKPKVGDLVAVRFIGKSKGTAFDDTFKTAEPYFFRAGVGLVVKGLDDSVVQMHLGDRYLLQFGGDYAFPKGKPSSPGRPRIAPGGDVTYEVELVELPGQGDDFIADVE